MNVQKNVCGRSHYVSQVIERISLGCMPGRSTTEAIFKLRQLIEKVMEKEKVLHVVFIDLQKAHNKVSRQLI